MTKSTCKHCHKEIGKWHEEYPEHAVWMHAPDDGPDAYRNCKCQCVQCAMEKLLGVEGSLMNSARCELCIDGEEAEPVEGR